MSQVQRNKGKRVAVLAPLSPNGAVGGAERFYDGLCTALRSEGCTVDLIARPTDESTFETILESYRQWGEVDLHGYDLVVSTKAPTYAVRHPRQVLYLVHTVRVFYDMFDQLFPAPSRDLLAQREKIQSLDNALLAKISHRFAIGHEVASRLQKFNGLQAQVLHPPLGMNQFRQGETGDYFFMPGRLHPWKRADLAVNAIKGSTLPMRLLIAGDGEFRDELLRIADGDPRIEFLGQISDEHLVRLYAGALAVPFISVREDYGYVTLEAFSSGKPVITCDDSGEPLHFVDHGRNGIICAATAEDLRVVMERLFVDTVETQRLGSNALQSMETMHDWKYVALQLLNAGAAAPSSTESHLNVAILDMQPIEPAIGGGRLRLLGLYHSLGNGIVARYVGSYDWPGEKPRRHFLSASLEEIDVPLSDEHYKEAAALSRESGGRTVIDIAFARLAVLSPDYLEAAREAIAAADIVVFSHPWIFPAVKSALRPHQVIVYDSQNVEAVLRRQLLGKESLIEQELLRDVIDAERSLGRRADLVLACSETDRAIFSRIYGWSPRRIHVVPNGVMTAITTPPTQQRRSYARECLQLSRPTAIFLGSDYQPNIDAARFVVDQLAAALPSIHFVIAGGVGASIGTVSQSNITVTGFLDDAQKQQWLDACDMAINPMASGSGTNIKMFDFMAAALPVITTAFGARGITDVSKAGLRIVSLEKFSEAIKDLAADRHRVELGLKNRNWVERDFAWESISPRLGALLAASCHHARRADPCETSQGADTSDKPHINLRVAHISTYGLKCGIGEYTRLLAEGMAAMGVENFHVTCTTPSARPHFDSPPSKWMVGWFQDNETWCNSFFESNLVDRLQKWRVEKTLIQYHPGFYSGELLENLIDQLAEGGIQAAVVIHSMFSCDMDVLRRVARSGTPLFSHNRAEQQVAATAGFAVAFLPLGIAAAKNRPVKSIEGRDWAISPPVLATSGFIREHKGLAPLINATALLQKSFPGTRLLIQCALYPAIDSQRELEFCRTAIECLGLNNLVAIDTEFRPLNEVYQNLAFADVAVLPYANSNEGGSAAAATCLAAGLPLIVSSANIFSELKNATFQIDDNSPAAIENAVLCLLRNPITYADFINRGTLHVQNHSWESVCSRLLNRLQTTPLDL